MQGGALNFLGEKCAALFVTYSGKVNGTVYISPSILTFPKGKNIVDRMTSLEAWPGCQLAAFRHWCRQRGFETHMAAA